METKQYKKIKDSSLLNLEKKLENGSTKEIVLNKFILKPDMNVKEIVREKESFKNIKNFIELFKNSTEEIVKDPELTKKLKIENCNQPGKHIRMNLALGVLDIKPKERSNEESLLQNVISSKNNSTLNTSDDATEVLSQHPFINEKADQDILKFLLNNKIQKKRRRIHKIKNNIK